MKKRYEEKDGEPVHPCQALDDFGKLLRPYGEFVFLSSGEAVHWEKIMQGLSVLVDEYQELEESVEAWFEQQKTPA